MATYYLINTVQVGQQTYKSGKYIDSTITPTAPITSGGGLLIASSDVYVAAAALIVQQMWKSGKGPSECDAVMLAAYQASLAAYELAHDAVGSTGVVRYGKITVAKPLLSELISIVADIQTANGPQILLTQPNVPCRLNVRLTCAGGVTAGTATVVGVGADGAALSQAVPLTGVTRTVVTDEAYASVTSVTVAGLAGGAAGDHISVGVSDYLGLPVPAAATSLSVYKETLDYANEAVGTLHAASRSISPTHAADGTHVFEFWYKYTLAHTHALS